MPLLIGLGVGGAALGGLNFGLQLGSYNKKMALAAATARYQPWTGDKPQIPDYPNAVGDVMSGGLAGLQLGQGIKGNNAFNNFLNAGAGLSNSAAQTLQGQQKALQGNFNGAVNAWGNPGSAAMSLVPPSSGAGTPASPSAAAAMSYVPPSSPPASSGMYSPGAGSASGMTNPYAGQPPGKVQPSANYGWGPTPSPTSSNPWGVNTQLPPPYLQQTPSQSYLQNPYNGLYGGMTQQPGVNYAGVQNGQPPMYSNGSSWGYPYPPTLNPNQ